MHDNDTNMPEDESARIVLRIKKIVANRRSATIVMNMTKTVVNLSDLTRPTKTLPHVYVHDSQRFTTTIEIVVNRGQNRDSDREISNVMRGHFNESAAFTLRSLCVEISRGSSLHFADYIVDVMPSDLQGNLENLRLRATCPICTELYTKPKKLPSCSHVFCLTCIRTYLKMKLPNNFPPCPMCRKPITKMLIEIDSLEPARAEEDIIDFVRPFENCDLCKKRERPTTKCLDCSSLICENCESAHSKLQPLHLVVSLFESNITNLLQAKHECKIHKNQSLELYCLMCDNILCVYCDRYAHVSCTITYSEPRTYLQNIKKLPHLMQDFIISSDERKTLIRDLKRNEASKRLPQHMIPVGLRVVQLREFSSFVRQYLGSLKAEVIKDVEFFDKYVQYLEAIVLEADGSGLLKERIKSIKSATGETISIAERGKAIISEACFLIDKSSDIEVVESALTAENKCLRFFKLRKTYSFESRCTEIGSISLDNGKSILRQLSDCIMQDETSSNICTMLFVIKIELSENTKTSPKALAIKLEKESGTDQSIESGPLNEKINMSVSSIKCINTNYTEKGTFESVISDNTFHTNPFLDETEARTDRGLSFIIRTVDEGFTGDFIAETIENHCLEGCSYDKTSSGITVSKAGGSSTRTYLTYFENILSAIPLRSQNGNILRGDRETDSASLICIIGARSRDSELETLFLEVEDKNKSFTHGLAVCSRVVRLKETVFIDGIRASTIAIFKNKHENYCFLKVIPYNQRVMCTYYSTLGNTASARKFYLVSEDGSESQVPISALKAELLCEVNAVMFYVKRGDDAEGIIVGRLKISRIQRNDDILFTMRQDHLSIPLRKLTPFTMAEAKNGDLVVVCAVEDDATTLVMILPMKQSVELLEVQHPSTEHADASITDLEMDSDGNIMYILTNNDGKMWRVMTKYIMPG